MRQALHTNEIAYETLVNQHREAVFRLAYLILGDADDAEDVAQETFIRAFRALRQFDSARPLRPWLLRITANLAYNRQRSIRRHLAALQRFFWITPLTVPDIAKENEQQQQARLLREAVTRLSHDDQKIIYLRFFLQLSVLETADVLQIKEGTVKSRLSRALNRLRIIIEQDFPMLREANLS